MDFLNSQQVDADSLERLTFDLFLGVSGNEKRCTFLYEKINIKTRDKVVLRRREKSSDSSQRENQRFYENSGFEFIAVQDFQNEEIAVFFKKFLKENNQRVLNILIDYSCMTKTWYSSIIRVILESESQAKPLNIYFSYSPSKYKNPPKPKALKKLERGFLDQNLSSQKPTALILGLGIEKSVADKVIKDLQPDLLVLMYADPSIDNKYTQTIFKNNEELIHQLEAKNLINYPLTDANAIHEIITEKCVELRLFYNVVIAPLGPKIFALNSYLLASRYPDVSVWNFSTVLSTKALNYLPSGELVIQKVSFVNDEEEY